LSAISTYAMVITPHPGDIELGMGGLVARWTREGKAVVFVLCTNGDKGTSMVNIKPQEMVVVREKEMQAGADALKVKEVVYLRHTDLGLEKTPELGEEILGLILKYRPEIVATCDPSLRYLSNPDHRATGRAVLDAVWPYAMAINAYPDLRQVTAVHRVNEILLWQPAEPDYYVDISSTYDLKEAALACHKTQVGDPFRPEFKARLKETARSAAAGRGYELGERFHRILVPEIL
jgi:LmbE family N-acetylglucosaminyl deacetylase